MATVYLIRHGQASFGAENYDKLSELGCRQAHIAGEYFRDYGIQFDAVYRRCRMLCRSKGVERL